MRKHGTAVCGRAWSQSVLCFCLALAAAGWGGKAQGQAATGTSLEGGTLYPRVVRLSHGPQASKGQLVASTNGVIFTSGDDGRTWSELGSVPTAAGSKERCCATLFEVPRRLGSLAAGTLLSAGSYFDREGVPAIEIYASRDGGRTWSFHGMPVRGGDAKHGLWEPEFEVATDGALVMFWSDETDPCCSQKLAQMRTYDGETWKDRRDTVATTVQGDRPGMITVSRLPNGHFFMSYEVCGRLRCGVYARTSADGWDFGPGAEVGKRVETARGQWLAHAPVNVWSPSAGMANGEIVLVGQMMFEADGSVSPLNGRVLWVNVGVEGAGAWTTGTAPVQVPEAYDNYCPNYSSALLPARDGSWLLELASAYEGEGVPDVCREGALAVKRRR